MFVLRNVGKLIFGSTAQETLIELPQGQLYLVRPLSPKGYSELIFKDSTLRIRRTNQDYHHQLVVQRVYEEGEAELLEDEQGDADADAFAAERDEKSFLLDEALHFRVEARHGGETVLAWRDLSGDSGDLFEFVCDSVVPASQVDSFIRIAKECQYERKYRKPHATASHDDLEQFEFQEEHPIPPASPISAPTLARSIDSLDNMVAAQKKAGAPAPKRPETPDRALDELLQEQLRLSEEEADQRATVRVGREEVEGGQEEEEEDKEDKEEAPHAGGMDADTAPKPLEIYAALSAELYVFDPRPGHFVAVDDSVTAIVSEVGKWEYWLQINGRGGPRVGTAVVAEFNPVFDFESLSFVFNHFPRDGIARSWLLRFKNREGLETMQEAVMKAIWERLNETKWSKIKEQEREYVLDSFDDLVKEDTISEEEEREEQQKEDDDEDNDEEGVRTTDYDSEDGEAAQDDQDGDINSQLAVGYKHDRSFVVRGSKIGVFSHTPDNRLKFSTNISKVTAPDGKLLNPKKVMLHSEDRDLIMQNNIDPTKLYRMDIEYGKVVDEWNVHDDIAVTTFAPENKFAQMTSEQTFLGISHNALFRVDPRLSGQKLVDSDLKQYASKNDFSALATTEKGYIAVASNKGDIRLFDRLGIRAKTQLPALGDPITGMDVSADGRWILGTTRNYILLVDALQQEGKNEGKLGFERGFAADSKPRPRRLALTPEHVAQFYHETGQPVSFTPAKFNTGTGEGAEETSVITATGPYIIEWSLKRILRGHKAAYKIKRYEDRVMADDFKFGSDKNVIVALPNEVNMVAKRSLRKPTRESIIGDLSALGGGSDSRRRSTRLTNLNAARSRRDDIVDSPY